MAYIMHVEKIAAEHRGITKTDWLQSHHTYSFGLYQDPKRVNFGTLRVFNDDRVQPGKGFNTHSHNNMEIVTVVLSGSLKHKDSQGNEGILQPGDVQRMTAGSGIQHSEYNASETEPLHFLQIWIYPEKQNLAPGYQQKNFSSKMYHNTFLPIVTQSQSEIALHIHQQATFYLGQFDQDHAVTHHLRSKNSGIYCFVIEGEIKIGGNILKQGDSAQISEVETLKISPSLPSKILMIEVNL